MILIGQYDSPFVRRVGIALTLYRLPFRHEPWSSFSDADKLRAYNPLTRVPTLVLEGGDVLIDSASMLDYLDSLMPPAERLFPVEEPARHRVMRVAALACGLGDKAVGLFYELRLHEQTSPVWVERCRNQIHATLALLEAERNAQTTPYWFGDRIGHADIAIAAVIRFVSEAHPKQVAVQDFPALAAFTTRLEALPAFRAIQQPFIPPA